MLGLVCEEFHCLPATAVDALENDIHGLIFKIIDLRLYAKAKQAYQEDLQQPDMSKRRTGPLIDRVRSTAFELAKERILRLKEENSD